MTKYLGHMGLTSLMIHRSSMEQCSSDWLSRYRNLLNKAEGVHSMLLHGSSCRIFRSECRALPLKPTRLLRVDRPQTRYEGCPDADLRFQLLRPCYGKHGSTIQARSSATNVTSEPEVAGPDSVVQGVEPYITHSWKWRDHTINYAVSTWTFSLSAWNDFVPCAGNPQLQPSVICRLQVAGCGPPVVFVHGFGASIGHFRKNVPALSQDYKVSKQASSHPLPIYSMRWQCNSPICCCHTSHEAH